MSKNEELVVLESMPAQHRSSHRAAGNFGVYPHNGAVRYVMPRVEAEEITDSDTDEYDHIVRVATDRDVERWGTTDRPEGCPPSGEALAPAATTRRAPDGNGRAAATAMARSAGPSPAEDTMKRKRRIDMLETPVVICTAKRAVVFGYITESGAEIIARGTVTLPRARMCQYWSAPTRGILGLAAIGPQAGSRVGPRVPQIDLESVTAVIVCTPEAAVAWESAPWT